MLHRKTTGSQHVSPKTLSCFYCFANVFWFITYVLYNLYMHTWIASYRSLMSKLCHAPMPGGWKMLSFHRGLHACSQMHAKQGYNKHRTHLLGSFPLPSSKPTWLARKLYLQSRSTFYPAMFLYQRGNRHCCWLPSRHIKSSLPGHVYLSQWCDWFGYSAGGGHKKHLVGGWLGGRMLGEVYSYCSSI